MTTVKDVARLAGVAPITVSRVINNADYIRDDTRERVMAAINQLGYVPNKVARSLRSNQTSMLALVLTDITNPFFTTVARGVEDAANAAGFNLILCNTDESEAKQENYLQILLERRVDGILLVPACSNLEPVQLIQRLDIPVVVLDRQLPGRLADVVRCDSEGGAYQLTRLLIQNGHNQIAILSGPSSVSTAEDRVKGYQRALREFGLELLDEFVYYGQFTLESGYQMTQQALNAIPRPTALLAGNNFIAIGALKALKDLHLSVPEDIAVVGFDDLPSTIVVDPILTAAAQPAYEMGRQGAELLLSRLTGSGPREIQEIILPIEIIVRQSSGTILSEIPISHRV
jgi:LacI family transcriptional regulator